MLNFYYSMEIHPGPVEPVIEEPASHAIGEEESREQDAEATETAENQ